MAITELSLTRTSPSTVRLDFSSDLASPTFCVWRDGVLAVATTMASYTAGVPNGTYPVWDVFDDAASEPDLVLPSQLVVQWEGLGGNAASYRVEAYEDAAWVTKDRQAERGDAYYQWRSGHLADETTYQYRVVAVAPDGNETVCTAMSGLMVRTPDPPDVEYTYDAGTGDVTMDLRS